MLLFALAVFDPREISGISEAWRAAAISFFLYVGIEPWVLNEPRDTADSDPVFKKFGRAE